LGLFLELDKQDRN